MDADSKNIEELEVHADETRYRPRKSTEELAKLGAVNELEFQNYQGMMPEMEEDRLVIDDISHYEMERLLEIYKPAIFCAGIKEKYAVQKWGSPASSYTATTTAGPMPASREPSTSIVRSIVW